MSISITQPDNVGITVESDPLAIKLTAYSSIAEALTNNPSPIKVHSAVNSQIAQTLNSTFGIQPVNWNSYTSGTGATTGGGTYFYSTRTMTAPLALTAGYSGIAALFGWNGTNANINFDRPIVISARFNANASASNAGMKARYYFTNDGGGHSQTATALQRKGFGFEYDYSTLVFSIITHDGTSQTVTAITAYTVITYKAFDVAVYSDGAGNVSLYINGVLYGTATSTGVTGSGTLSYSWANFSLFQDVTTSTGGTQWTINNPKVYLPIA